MVVQYYSPWKIWSNLYQQGAWFKMTSYATGLSILTQSTALIIFYVIGCLKYPKLKVLVEFYMLFFLLTCGLSFLVAIPCSKLDTPKCKVYVSKISPVVRKEPATLEEIVAETAVKYHVPIRVAFALVSVESGWNPNAISHAGAKGLCQIMPGTFVGLAPKDANIMNPKHNAEAGMKYLRALYEETGNWHTALARYNGGYKYQNSGEAQGYARMVLKIANNRNNEVWYIIGVGKEIIVDTTKITPLLPTFQTSCKKDKIPVT